MTTHSPEQLAFDHLPNIAFVADCNGDLLSANKMFRKVSGYKECKKLNVVDLISEFQRPAWNEFFESAGQINTPSIEGSLVTRGGKHIPIRLSTSAFSTGRSKRVTFTAADSSAELDLKLRHKQLSQYLFNAERVESFCTWSKSLSTGEESWSDGAYRFFGVDAQKDEISFSLVERQFSELYRERLVSNLEQCEKSGKEVVFEAPIFVRGESAPRFVRCVMDATLGRQGAPFRLNGIFCDITKQKSTELRLRQAKTIAESSNLAKIEFLGTFSHEIKTPIAVIDGYASLLEAESLSDDAKEYVSTLRKNSDYLLKIVNQLLASTKQESELLKSEIKQINLSDMLESIASTVDAKMKSKTVDFKIVPVFPLPETFGSDPSAVMRILINLLDNAIKYTETGSITLKVSYDSKRLVPSLMFEVEDTGPGIEAKYLSKIFKPFQRLSNHNATPQEGAGLGLNICKKLADQLNSELSVASKIGAGSKFSFVLPISKLHNGQLVNQLNFSQNSSSQFGPSNANEYKGRRALIVDDSSDLRALYGTMLGFFGLSVDMAEDGLDCLKKAKSSQQTNPYDLILMDLKMPKCSGTLAARKLRDTGWTGPIVALTAANLTEEAKKDCLDAGYSSCFSKTVGSEGIASILSQYL